MSYLTTPIGTLQAQVAAALEGEGFPYNPLRTSWGEYLSTALGEPTAYLHKSHAQMLSEIDAQYGGSLSHLRASIAQLLDDLVVNIGDGGGGGAPYVAGAVQVDDGTFLVNPSLVSSAESGLLTYVYWLKMGAGDFAKGGVMWVQDPENFYPSNSYFDAAAGAGLIHHQMCSAQDENCFGAVIGHAGDGTAIPLDTWVPLMVSFDTRAGTVEGFIAQAYLGDTEVLYSTVPTFAPGANTSLAPFFATWNGLSFHVFDDGNPAVVSGAFADFWFAPGQFIDFSIEANRRKFIDASGKPVYLGANGEAPTGTAPAVFFSGGASSFATNKGTGGAFTLTGALADASTSPSD